MKRLAFYANEMVANQAEPGDDWNFTAIELSKVPFFIEKTSSDLSKWLFFFRYLNRLKELPEELNEEKFKDLTESAKVSKFSKKEFEAYRNMYHKIWKTLLFFVANSKCKDDARSYDC